MSTAQRKARKRAGIQFEKPAKVGTPLQERAWFAGLVMGPQGTRHAGKQQERSAKKKARALAARGIETKEQGR